MRPGPLPSVSLVDPSVWITVEVSLPSPFKFWSKMGSSASNAVLVPGNCADQVAGVVTVAVCGPDCVLAASGILPGHVVAARRLYRADRRPAAKLTGCNIGIVVLQRGVRAAAV